MPRTLQKTGSKSIFSHLRDFARKVSNNKWAQTAGHAVVGTATFAAGPLAPLLYAYTAYNRASKARSFPNLFTPEEYQSFLKDYQTLLGLKGATFSADAFDKYMKARPEGLELFKETKTAAGKNIFDAIKVNGKIKSEIEQIFKPSDKLLEQQREYAVLAEAFQKFATKVPVEHSVDHAYAALKKRVDDARAAIQAQQKLEKEQLTAALEGQLKNELITTLGITEADYPAVSKAMLADLDKAHGAQIGKFDSSSQDSLNKLLVAGNKHAAKMQLFQNIKLGDIVTNKNREKDAKLSRGVNPDEDKEHFDIEIGDIASFKTKTGQTIERTKEGKYILMPGSILSSPLYFLVGNHFKTDLKYLVQAIKADGFASINIKIIGEDPGQLKKNRRMAFEAALEGGFPVDKIHILDSTGKKIPPLEFMSQEELDDYKKQSPAVVEAFRTKEADVDENAPPSIAAKDALQKIVNEIKAKPPAPASKLQDTPAATKDDEEEELNISHPS